MLNKKLKQNLRQYRIIAIIPMITMIYLSCCSKYEEKANYLINENFLKAEIQVIGANELLGGKINYINLDSKGSANIGRINKIIKRNQFYFILSDDNRILQFDTCGNYISLLNKVGKGPDEYLRIEDFDVHIIENQLQIWLSNYSEIKIYNYNQNWNLLKTLDLPFIIHKFKRLKNGKLLLMTGQKEKTLTLINKEGETEDEFLEKQIPFLTLKSVQFIEKDNDIIFPLGVANKYVKYNQDEQQFSYGEYLESEKLISQKELLNLYNQKGLDFFRDLKTKTYINNIRFLKNKTIVQFNKSGERYLAVIYHNNKVTCGRILPNATIKDNITKKDNINYLTTILYGESNNSVILIQEPTNTNEGISIIEIL